MSMTRRRTPTTASPVQMRRRNEHDPPTNTDDRLTKVLTSLARRLDETLQ